MNEAQVWTIIGVLGATIVGMVTFGFTMMLRVMRAEIGGLRAELQAEMRGGLERIDQRLDTMNRDISALMRHTFGIDRE